MRENWQSVNELAFNLADQIEKHCIETGEQFDRIILIPRGSYAPGNIISRRLGFGAQHILHMCMTSREDGDIDQIKDFIYGQMPLPKEVEGLDHLIIEEVAHTGTTLKHATELLELAGAGLVRTAALHLKRKQSCFIPDFYANETESWIVYPWEKDERIGNKSAARRLSPEEQERERIRFDSLLTKSIEI